MAIENGTVHVVDDDPQVLESLILMVRSMELSVESYPSAEAFLERYHDDSDGPRCLVLDVRLSGLSGLELQQMLAAEGSCPPIIMMSGCADISMAVKAMLGGAMDFIEKPISRQALSSRIRRALDADVRGRRAAHSRQELARRVARLSARQRDVLDLLVTGARSKQIANRLGIGEKTVAKHRAAVLEKMEVESVVELIRLFTVAQPAPLAALHLLLDPLAANVLA